MSTVRRDFRASPHRTGSETWEAIAQLLATSQSSAARKELSSVAGIVGQIISSESVKTHPIVSSGSGPRVRIYCLYDEDAQDEDSANEEALSFDATGKDWKVSIPVEEEDISWSKAALKDLSSRITVREKSEDVGGDEESQATKSFSLELDPKAFLRQ
jgi:hypothetical protein